MSNRVLGIILVFLLGVSEAAAVGDSLLRRVSKKETPQLTSIRMDLSAIPKSNIQTSGQRVDIFLEGVELDSSMPAIPEDGTLIKALIGKRDGQLILSLLFSQPPQKVNLRTEQTPPSLTLEVVHGRTDARPMMTESPGREMIVDGQVLRKGTRSAYAGRWEPFFNEYETPLQPPLPVQYSLPVLPQLIYTPVRKDEVGKQLSAGIDLANQGQWAESLKAFKGLKSTDLEGVDREAFLILRGEGYARTKSYDRATDALNELLTEHPESALLGRARFLSMYIQAATSGPYVAQYEFPTWMQQLEQIPFYHAYGLLLRAEVAMDKGRYSEATEWFRDEGLFRDGRLEKERLVRLADILAAQNKNQQAYDQYAGAALTDEFLTAHPDSLARWAEIQYWKKNYSESARLYGMLAEKLPEKGGKDLALYAKARGTFQAGGQVAALLLLSDLKNQDSDSESRCRAWMDLIDYKVSQGLKPDEGDPPLVIQYGELAKRAPLKALREEAYFKKILLALMEERYVDAFADIQEFRRSFALGNLTGDMESLVEEYLPKTLTALFQRNQQLEALVIVEQNRKAIAAGKLSQEILRNLGDGFYRLGLWARAEKIYRFLLDAKSGTPEEEPIYPQLLQVLEVQQRNLEIIELSDRYLSRFPKGANRFAVRLFKGRSLDLEGQPDKALEALHGDEGAGVDGEIYAAGILWKLKKYEDVARALQIAMDKGASGSALTLQRAEALYRSGKLSEALPFFQKLIEEENTKDQARFRSAQIYRATGNEQEALKNLQILVDETGDSLWKKMAVESLALRKESKF